MSWHGRGAGASAGEARGPLIGSGCAELAREPLGLVAVFHRTTMPSSRLAERAEEWRTKAPRGLRRRRTGGIIHRWSNRQ
jgi:hypothetical protein